MISKRTKRERISVKRFHKEKGILKVNSAIPTFFPFSDYCKTRGLFEAKFQINIGKHLENIPLLSPEAVSRRQRGIV